MVCYCNSKTKIKIIGFHCPHSRTKPQKLVPNLTSNRTATWEDVWAKWVFNLFTLSFFLLNFAPALLNFHMLGRLHEIWQTELSLYQIAKQICENCLEVRTCHKSLHYEQYHSPISWHQPFKACSSMYVHPISVWLDFCIMFSLLSVLISVAINVI